MMDVKTQQLSVEKEPGFSFELGAMNLSIVLCHYMPQNATGR